MMNWLWAAMGVVLVAYACVCAFYAILQERFIFIRFRTPKRYVYRFPQPFEERYMEGEDGARLHALHFRAEAPRGVVLYFHGNTGSVRRWGKFAPRFVRMGYDVLMPDPRGYGKSRGELSEAALIADADAWYEELLKEYDEQRIVVLGRSLGSGLATPVAARHKPRMLILETPFANLYDVAMNYLPILPYRLLLRYPFRNDKAIRRVTCPVYILHGKFDATVPYASALKLYAAVPSDVVREMISFPKGHHSDLPRFPRYQRFLERVLRPDPNATFAPLNTNK
ncbi:MAG: alpha/beta hydrolase [Flavobacteriales bacterium]|nr:alpha/beta hydrolase [Flavobacteriales bacterium]